MYFAIPATILLMSVFVGLTVLRIFLAPTPGGDLMVKVFDMLSEHHDAPTEKQGEEVTH